MGEDSEQPEPRQLVGESEPAWPGVRPVPWGLRTSACPGSEARCSVEARFTWEGTGGLHCWGSCGVKKTQ